MTEYFAAIERAGLPLNVVQTVGHTQVRRLVLGEVDRRATPDELERMKALVREAMEAGAIGLSIEQAVARMTSIAASDLKLYDRGRIAIGTAADLVVFDSARVQDRSTFAEPTLTAVGITHVLVNGQFVIEAGKSTPARPGTVLRRPGTTRPPRSGRDEQDTRQPSER